MSDSPSAPLPEGHSDPLLVEVADVVAAVGRRLQMSVHDMEGLVPLTGTEISVVRWVDRHPGVTPSAAAEATGLRRPNLSAALRGLGEKGLITRTPDRHDSRIVHLHATDLARDSGRRVREAMSTELSRCFPALDDEDREALRRTMRILASADGGPAGPDPAA